VATGSAKEKVEKLMKEAVKFHLEGLRREGCDIPEPLSYSTYLEVSD
jgi:predicted RNase H-like HicB family nuclease